MARKVKVVNKVKRAKIQNFYTDNDKLDMLKLYHRDKWTQSQIAEKYGTTRQFVNKIIKDLNKNIEIEKGTLKFMPDKVLERKNLEKLERIAMINSDALEVVELTIALAKHKIQNTLKAIKDADELKPGEQSNVGNAYIDIDKLTKLLSTALPYVIPKPETNKGDGLNKKPVTKLHKLMNNTIKRETA